MKTTISIDDKLLQDIAETCRELKISRSKLFAMAAETFLRQRKQHQVMEQLNQVYDGTPDPIALNMKVALRRTIKDRW